MSPPLCIWPPIPIAHSISPRSLRQQIRTVLNTLHPTAIPSEAPSSGQLEHLRVIRDLSTTSGPPPLRARPEERPAYREGSAFDFTMDFATLTHFVDWTRRSFFHSVFRATASTAGIALLGQLNGTPVTVRQLSLTEDMLADEVNFAHRTHELDDDIRFLKSVGPRKIPPPPPPPPPHPLHPPNRIF